MHRWFASGSRDQTVKFWHVGSDGTPGASPAACLPPFPAGVTFVALAPLHVCAALAGPAGGGEADEQHVLAVGLEDGQVEVWRVALPAADGAAAHAGSAACATRLWVSPPWQRHAGTVRRLRWAPAGAAWLCGGAGGGVVAQLASCGDDHAVRVFGVEAAG